MTRGIQVSPLDTWEEDRTCFRRSHTVSRQFSCHRCQKQAPTKLNGNGCRGPSRRDELFVALCWILLARQGTRQHYDAAQSEEQSDQHAKADTTALVVNLRAKESGSDPDGQIHSSVLL